MPSSTDVRPLDAALYLLPIETRVPLKFGPEITTEVTCARVRMTVIDRQGHVAEGWGETPLSVQWVWPSVTSYAARLGVLTAFTQRLTRAWAEFGTWGHPLEIGHAFTRHRLGSLEQELAAAGGQTETGPMPHLAALVCSSAFDLALYDAYGKLHCVNPFETFQPPFLNADLAHFLEPARGSDGGPVRPGDVPRDIGAFEFR